MVVGGVESGKGTPPLAAASPISWSKVSFQAGVRASRSKALRAATRLVTKARVDSRRTPATGVTIGRGRGVSGGVGDW